ncbi:ribonuclease H-like domain-containing protein [Tanacetum coccineum]
MTSFDCRLKAIKACSACGNLHTSAFCCSKEKLKNKILVPMPESSQQHIKIERICFDCGNLLHGLNCLECDLTRKILEKAFQNQTVQDVKIISDELSEYINTPAWNRPLVYCDDDDDEDYTIAIHTISFYIDNDHFKEKSSGSTTTHVDFSQYDSFIFDLSNDQFPPANGSDFHEEFADELAQIISQGSMIVSTLRIEPELASYNGCGGGNIFQESEHEFIVVVIQNTVNLAEPTVIEPKVVDQPKVWSDAPKIEEYESNSEDEHVSHPTQEQEQPSSAKFKNRDFIEFYGSKGIKREYSIAKTPQQNGVAEKTVSTACYILNRALVIKPHNKTPYELVTGKFDGKSDEGFLVGSENQANKHAGPQEANQNAGTEDIIDIRDSEKEDEYAQDYFVLPIWSYYSSTVKRSIEKDAGRIAAEFKIQKVGCRVDCASSEEGNWKQNGSYKKKKEEKRSCCRNKAKILKKFDFVNVKTASTPIETQKPLVKDEEASDVDVHLYRSIDWVFNVFDCFLGPDSMLQSVLVQFQVTPKTSHLSDVKRIFRKPNREGSNQRLGQFLGRRLIFLAMQKADHYMATSTVQWQNIVFAARQLAVRQVL